MTDDPFTINKATVRELDFKLINRYLLKKKGSLRYFGLPGRNLVELRAWDAFFCHYSAVERGRGKTGHVEQHNLLLTTMRYGLSNKLTLLRGEMDEILVRGKDQFGTEVQYPFDVISLDYSGGILYKDPQGKSVRVQSISQMLWNQASHDKDFLLFISSNLDNEDKGEINRILTDLNRELAKMGINANEVIASIRKHRDNELRLKVYVPMLIKNLTEQWYKCEFNKAVFYLGNRETHMMHCTFWLKRTQNYVAGRPTPSDLLEILNKPAYICKNGKLRETTFGIPKVEI